MEGERHSLSSVKTENEYLGSLKTSFHFEAILGLRTSTVEIVLTGNKVL